MGETIVDDASFAFKHRHAFIHVFHHIHDCIISKLAKLAQPVDLFFVLDPSDIIEDRFRTDGFDLRIDFLERTDEPVITVSADTDLFAVDDMSELIFELIHETDDDVILCRIEMIFLGRNSQDRRLSFFVHVDHDFRYDMGTGDRCIQIEAVALPKVGCAFSQILEIGTSGKQDAVESGLFKFGKTFLSSFTDDHN